MNLQKMVKKAVSEKSETQLLFVALCGVSQGHKLYVTSDHSQVNRTREPDQVERYKEASREASGKPVSTISPYSHYMERSDDELWEALEEQVDNPEILGAGNWLSAIWPAIQALCARLFGDEEQVEPVEPEVKTTTKRKSKKEQQETE